MISSCLCSPHSQPGFSAGADYQPVGCKMPWLACFELTMFIGGGLVTCVVWKMHLLIGSLDHCCSQFGAQRSGRVAGQRAEGWRVTGTPCNLGCPEHVRTSIGRWDALSLAMKKWLLSCCQVRDGMCVCLYVCMCIYIYIYYRDSIYNLSGMRHE